MGKDYRFIYIRNFKNFERCSLLLKTLPLLVFIFITIFQVPFLWALTVEEIIYGADSYSIDYDNEIIYAEGNVYFISGGRKVTSSKARIYYSKDKQVARFFQNVVFQDRAENVTIKGAKGIAYYHKDIYIIEGNAEFIDTKRRISAESIEYHSGIYSIFNGMVRFIDDQYEIKCETLRIEENRALFSGEVVLKVKENNNMVYCKKLIYGPEKNNYSFTGGALYVPGNEKEPIVSADSIIYLADEKLYNFIDNVYIKGENYIIRAPLVKYVESEDILYALGGVFTVMNDKYVQADRMKYNLSDLMVEYSGNVTGIIKMDE